MSERPKMNVTAKQYFYKLRYSPGPDAEGQSTQALAKGFPLRLQNMFEPDRKKLAGVICQDAGITDNKLYERLVEDLKTLKVTAFWSSVKADSSRSVVVACRWFLDEYTEILVHFIVDDFKELYKYPLPIESSEYSEKVVQDE